MPYPLREVQVVGTVVSASVWWGGCPAADGPVKLGHSASWDHGRECDHNHLYDHAGSRECHGGLASVVIPEDAACSRCGEPFDFTIPEERRWKSMSSDPRYNTEDGKMHPGDMYYSTGDTAGWEFPACLETSEPEQGKRGAYLMSSEWYDRARALGGPFPMPYIMLPGNVLFCPYWAANNGAVRGDGTASGWTLSGEGTDLTCSPSIWVGSYHGWLQNGVLSDPV
jgi:hypothetical protein